MKFPIREATASGYILMDSGGLCDLSYPSSKNRRGRVQGGGKICPTITSTTTGIVQLTTFLKPTDMEMTTFPVKDSKTGKEKQCVALIRKLTPRECFRLMGVDDEDIDKIQASGISKSAMYKCAGNSIVVDVLYHIFRKAFVETGNESKQMSIFDLL